MNKYFSLFIIILILCCSISGCKNTESLNESDNNSFLEYKDSTSLESNQSGYSTSSQNSKVSKPVIKHNNQNTTGISSNGNTTTEKSNIVVEDIPVTNDSDNNRIDKLESTNGNSNIKKVYYNNVSLSKKEYYQYNSLSQKEKEIYDIITDSILTAKNVVNLKSYSIPFDNALIVLQKVIADNPQLFWLAKKTSILYNEKNQLSYYLMLYYTDGSTTDNMNSNYELTSFADRYMISNQIVTFNNKVDEFINTVPDSFSDIEKEKIIHDYVIDTIYYDTASASQNYTYDDTLPRCFDAYGAICDRKAVCEGYSKIFQYLCYCVGINATQVTGTVDGGNHMWNAVKIANEWYQMDTTWDDTLNSIPYYEYFNFTTKRANQERDIDSTALSVPECYSTENSFVNAFCCIVSNSSMQPDNYKKSADELDITGRYVIVYLNVNHISRTYIMKYFLSSNSLYKQYIHSCNYKFDLNSSYKVYGNYLYIEIKR